MTAAPLRVKIKLKRGGEVILSLTEWVNEVYITDMPERKREAVNCDGCARVLLRPFEIASLRLVKKQEKAQK